MGLKSISTDPFNKLNLNTEEQLNAIYYEHGINKLNIVSIITYGSSVIVTYEDNAYISGEGVKT